MKKSLVVVALLIMQSLTLAQYKHDNTFPTDTMMLGKAVHGIAVDPEGKVWIIPFVLFPGDSIVSNGINRAVAAIRVYNPNGTKASFSPIHFLSGADISDTLFSASSQRGINRDKDGNILYSYGGYLYRINYKTGAVMAKLTLFPNLSGVQVASDMYGNVFTGLVLPNTGPIQMFDYDFVKLGNVVDTTRFFSRALASSKTGDRVYYAGYTSHSVIRYTGDPLLGYTADTVLKGFDCESINRHGQTDWLWASAGSGNDMPNRYPGLQTYYSSHTWYLWNPEENKIKDSIKWAGNWLKNITDSMLVRPRGVSTTQNGDTVYVCMFGGITGMYSVQRFILANIETRALPLKTSWNLVSWNVDTPVDSTLSVLSAVKSKVKVGLGYNNGGLTYDPTIPFQFNTLTQMDHLHGYWLKMLDTATLYVQGTAVNGQTPLNLTTGYNLVSYLPLNADSLTHALTSVLPQTTVVLGYDNGGLTYDPTIPSQFNTLQIMRPGYGYWIKAKSNGTLTYPASSVYSGAGAVPEGMLSKQSTEVTPTQGWVSLWGDNINLRGMIIPEGTKISVRSQSGVICAEGKFWGAGTFGLMPIYLDDETTEEIEGLKKNEGFAVMIGDYSIPKMLQWKEMGEVINLHDAATGVAELGTFPTEYALDQNYPNPFNPSTTIRYQLPEAGKVSLKVYNTLGMEVETLDESHKDAGFYSINWNAGRLASGVYFYELISNKYKSIKKLLFIK